MGTEWLSGLATEFKIYLEEQKFVDVIFSCQDGQVLGHKLILSCASNFLKELLSTSPIGPVSEVVVVLPDVSAYDVSDFLLALYGGSLPADTSGIQELFRMFEVHKKYPFKHPSRSKLSEIFGQMCSEIEQEFSADVKAPSHQPKYIAKRLPANAQLLQLPKPAPVAKPCLRGPTENSVETSNHSELNNEEKNDDGVKYFWTCHVCAKREPTQENLREHMKRNHSQDGGVVKSLKRRRSNDVTTADEQNSQKVQTIRENQSRESPDGKEVTPQVDDRETLQGSNSKISKFDDGKEDKVSLPDLLKVFGETKEYDNHNPPSKPAVEAVVCSKCNTAFETIQKLNYHIKIVHLREVPTKSCNFCNRKFFQRKNLRKHCELKHRGEMKLQELSDSISVTETDDISVKDEIECSDIKKD